MVAIHRVGEEVRDITPNAVSSKMTTPEERLATAIVFKSYDRMSYGLVMESDREIHVGDTIRNP